MLHAYKMRALIVTHRLQNLLVVLITIMVTETMSRGVKRWIKNTTKLSIPPLCVVFDLDALMDHGSCFDDVFSLGHGSRARLSTLQSIAPIMKLLSTTNKSFKASAPPKFAHPMYLQSSAIASVTRVLPSPYVL